MDRKYREYVTDALKCIAENTARINGGSYLTGKFSECNKSKKEERTPQEIISKMRNKLNGYI